MCKEIEVHWNDGHPVAIYSAYMLALFQTDPAVDCVIATDTGEIIYDKR